MSTLREVSLAMMLTSTIPYFEHNHDEGCELDPEYGETNFERNNDVLEQEVDERGDEDVEFRDWPDDRKCTCGTHEFVAQIRELVAG